jgi:hypothetical protein
MHIGKERMRKICIPFERTVRRFVATTLDTDHLHSCTFPVLSWCLITFLFLALSMRCQKYRLPPVRLRAGRSGVRHTIYYFLLHCCQAYENLKFSPL